MDEEALQGGCHCGRIRYEARGRKYHPTLCHCTICRGTSGAPAVAWFTVALGDFTLLKGTPGIYRATNHARRSFCTACGTQLFFREDALQEIDISTASLDEPQKVPPLDHTWVRSRIGWMNDTGELPGHACSRGTDPQ